MKETPFHTCMVKAKGWVKILTPYLALDFSDGRRRRDDSVSPLPHAHLAAGAAAHAMHSSAGIPTVHSAHAHSMHSASAALDGTLNLVRCLQQPPPPTAMQTQAPVFSSVYSSSLLEVCILQNQNKKNSKQAIFTFFF